MNENNLDLKNKHTLKEKFREDSLLFKSFLRILVKNKVDLYLGKSYTQDTPIEQILPLKNRSKMIHEMEEHLRLTMPKLQMSKRKKLHMFIVMSVTLLLELILSLIWPELLIVPFFGGFWGIAIYLILATIPLFAFNLIRPYYFSGLDLIGVETYRNFLSDIVMENHYVFSSHDFEKSFELLSEVLVND